MISLQLTLLGLGTLAAWLLWTVLQRLVLHDLASVPGPTLPALTRWYECWYEIWQPGKYPFKLKELHEKYGPILRPVPDEVHINDPDFLDTIYAIRNRNNPTIRGLLVDQSVGGAEDWHVHKMRRDALNPYFSQKFTLSMQDLMLQKRDQVIEQFFTASRSGQPFNLSDVYFAFSNDLVRNFCFGSDSDLLHNLPEAQIQRKNLTRMLTGVKVNKHFPFVPRLLANILPVFLGNGAIPPAVMDLMRFRARCRADIEAVFKDRKNDNKGRHSIFYELRDSPSLPPEEKTVRRLQDEAQLLVMAGTESLAKSLAIASFHLISNPSTLSTLRAELSSARQTSQHPDQPVPLTTLLTLPYLNAVITEANRLSFGVTNRIVRYSPTETLSYTASSGPHKGTNYVFPPRTKMSCCTYCTHTNPSLFPDPLKFLPERFLGEGDEVAKRKRCMMALGKGHRRCLGINVANAGMCLIVAAVAEWDMKAWDTDERDVAFLHDYQVAHGRLDSKGVRVVVKGRNGVDASCIEDGPLLTA
ncbi:unnamed protein product [Zymoseptoria tritici ST99CH_1A5]|uniref:Cytochrome P450 n=2 Tax=Zymoseptoria tritici TaxID=1047171 RepID=A0A1Y6L2Z8_ZYMTR|nr:unnamed protein product [Zymoseptoria tritici ST99CH_3D1]SMY18747.1 unnamed protein product [Zymoseptoria tritici ST99CH_1A5]